MLPNIPLEIFQQTPYSTLSDKRRFSYGTTVHPPQKGKREHPAICARAQVGCLWRRALYFSWHSALCQSSRQETHAHHLVAG